MKSDRAIPGTALASVDFSLDHEFNAMSEQSKTVVEAFRKLSEIEQAEAYIEIDRLWKDLARNEIRAARAKARSA